MTHLAQLEFACSEAQAIVAQAEEQLHLLQSDGACEGQRLMAAQIVAALKHLKRMVEHHHAQAASAAIPDAAGRPSAGRERWWNGLGRRARTGMLALDARI